MTHKNTVKTHNLGFPRIGDRRQLKFALERYWQGTDTLAGLADTASTLRLNHWQAQKACDWVPVGDFSYYDHVLDMSFLLGHVPDRVANGTGPLIDKMFRVARGRSTGDSLGQCVHAGEMTKWFNTNYHFIVPECTRQTTFQLQAEALLGQILEAQQAGVAVKPVLIGPVTYLHLSKSKDGVDRLSLLPTLLEVYRQLLSHLSGLGITWVQIDEPVLCLELDANWQRALEQSYHYLKAEKIQVLVATYFGRLKENLKLACQLPVAGLHVDALKGRDEVKNLIDWLPIHKILSLGVVNGRNIWKTDLTKTLDWLEPIANRLKDRLWLAPSCSLLHVPVDVDLEENLDPEIKSWLAFAKQKLTELEVLKKALNQGRSEVEKALLINARDINGRTTSSRVHNPLVQRVSSSVTELSARRQSAFLQRSALQSKKFNLPLFPTTTIGSFPQTSDLRKIRKHYKQGKITEEEYRQSIQTEITFCIQEQEKLGLDVLVHGEAERNDMVEYFGEQLDGYAFSEFGWVQSYGSRCVKPPILYGDIHRQHNMTVAWAVYAQSQTKKRVKGMLTGPVTMLNWSFVRDDQALEETCFQLALAIREEVLALEAAGIHIIQIDEAALREGLPLRHSEWGGYLQWAIDAFRIATNAVKDDTQIHTHMCYSEFNDIIGDIARMDADVVTIETSRSDMALLDVFESFSYPNDIGPGVYDIHSPNIPSEESIVKLMQLAAQRIPADRLWINPDCGLKTRGWEDVMPALRNMVNAAKHLRH